MIPKKIGKGTFSLLLALLAIIWGIQWDSGISVRGLGIYVLSFLGLGELIFSNTFPLYLASYIFIIPAIIMGRKYKENWGAKAGYNISIAYGSICLFGLLAVIFLNLKSYLSA